MHCRRLKRRESALYKIELPEEKELTFYHTDVTLTLFILQINLFSYKQVTRTSCFISSMVYLHKTWKFFWEGWGGGGGGGRGERYDSCDSFYFIAPKFFN